MLDKSYDELIKEKEYQQIANILMNSNECRKDNRVLIKEFYKKVYGISVDEAFTRNDIPNYQSIERKARLLKQVNHKLRYDKSKQVEIYERMSLERPVAISLF